MSGGSETMLSTTTLISLEQTFRTLDREVRNTITARCNKRSFTKLMSAWIR
ncbi:hypothetical protein F2Q69_00034557 [Brassica cretica]|uniref:Uncharacterized protein n=1 Tax=Brassica cretica TaxID=69181 RepID=A0A8S9SGX7_BRACR|nr:hypothetical protein F2Q69_00034557 [Brassica cretica]